MQPRIVNSSIIFKPKDLAQARQIRTCIPQVRFQEAPIGILGAVPLTLEAARVLRNLGIEAPSPIEAVYNWPIIPGRKPRPHQVKTSAHLTLNPRAHCHNSPRTGKTLSSLWAIDYLQRIGVIGRALIVAPLSTLERAWGDEIFLNFPGKKFAVLHGSADKRRKLLAEPNDLYVINHDGVEILQKELMARGDIDLIVIDECFPAGTKVLTPQGERCIETVQLGDLVCSSWGEMPVTHVFKKEAAHLVQVNFEDGSYVRCTPEHPFATDAGWVAAKDTTGFTCLRGSDLQALWQNLPGVFDNHQAQPNEVLQPKVRSAAQSDRGGRRDESVCGLRDRVLCTGGRGQVQTPDDLLAIMQPEAHVGDEARRDDGRVREGLREETREAGAQQRHPDQTRNVGEIECLQEVAARSVFGCSRRERHRNVKVGSTGAVTSPGEIRVQSGDPDTYAERERVSDLLQSGLWRSNHEDGSRGRWGEPRIAETPSTGPEENRFSLGVRVVSVQGLELCGPQTVYNLEVAGPHDYIAAGKVVHNCAVFRNAKTNRWKAMNAVVNNRGISTWCWGLTGTPTSNEPTDAYGQAKLVRPESVKGVSFTSFKDLTMQQFGPFRWVPRRGSEETVARVLSPSIRFDRSTVTNMEPCLIERHAELSPEQKHHINKLLREAVTEIDGATVSAVNAAVLISKIVQAACGAVIGSGGELIRMDFGPRLKVLEEAIEENNGEKVIVFLPFKGPLNIVANELKKKWSVEVVDGGVSAGKRNQIYKDFQTKKDPHVLVAHPQCMAHGLELTAASLIVYYAPITSNEIYTQACCRIDGGGQKSKIDIMHISATPTERRIYSVVREKGKLQDVVLDLLKGAK